MAEQLSESLTPRRTFVEEGTRQRYELMELAAGLSGVIALGRGDPDLPTPAHIIDAAKRAIETVGGSSSPTSGLLQLREAIAEKLRVENGIHVSGTEGVVVTTGGQEAVYLAVQALLSPGDEILVPDPRYTSYDVSIEMAGARLVLVPTNRADGFQIHADDLERLITPHTRAILLISPGNPTAGVLTQQHLEQIRDVAVKHDLVVIADEIYEKLIYEGARHLSIAALPGMGDRTLTVNGFSKTYCMTGWRLGYLAGPAKLMKTVHHLKRTLSGAPPIISQYAGLAALQGPNGFLAEYVDIYSQRRRIVLAALDDLGFAYGRPMGAFYVFVDASSIGRSAYDLSRNLLLDGKVLIFPGTAFGPNWNDYFRMSWLQPIGELEEALSRMKRVLRSNA
jgi:aminotransferase